MMRGLLEKITREVWAATLLFALAMAVVEALLSAVVPLFFDDAAGPLLEMPFIQAVIKGLLGTDVSGGIPAGVMATFAWVHPVVLTLVWAQEIFFCTRMPAGEIDRGTIDVLVSLPASRGQLYSAEALAWLVSGLIMLSAGACGYVVGRVSAGLDVKPHLGSILIILANLYALYFAVGGVALFASASSDRRGRAVASVFAFVLVSFLLNFIAQLWEPASRVAFLSVMNYYRPMTCAFGAGWPVNDMIVLLMVGVVFGVAGGVVFARRDIRTT